MALAVFALPFNISQEAKTVLAITVFIAVLWFTEALFLWVTALLIPALLVLFTPATPIKVFAPFFDPIIALLLGGFILARAIEKHGLALKAACFFTNYFGNKRINFFLLIFLLMTAFFSFWLPNTATAALMMPIGLAIIAANKLKLDSNFGKIIALGIAYASNVGGIGTPIGTAPNLIAIRWLADSGIQVNFIDWMLRGAPLALVMTFIVWFVLIKMYKPEIKKLNVVSAQFYSDLSAAPGAAQAGKQMGSGLNKKQFLVSAVFILTVILWLTEPLHKIHNSIVAIFSLILLYGLKLLDQADLDKIGWGVLILVGGGLVLGGAMHQSGLDAIMANNFAELFAGQSNLLLFFGLSVGAIGLTVFVANTAAAAVLIPIMIPMASILNINPIAIALLLGMVVSFDFVVPAGTPPNAIAYGTGCIKIKDMIKAGLLLSILGAAAISLFALFW